MRKTTMVLLILGLIGVLLPRYSQSEEQTTTKKKGHLWLIPVLAGAGFAAGTYIGLSAFDDSINSDKKVWTTVALFSVGGGIAGWLIGRPKAEHIQSYGLPIQKFEIRRTEDDQLVLSSNHSELKAILLDMQASH
jgi:hypothetical protein